MTSSPASLDLFCEPLRQDTSEVERVLLKSVALDPDLRFPSASQFVDALDEASAARDAVAKVGSTVSSSGRRAVAVAGAAVVVVLVLVATGLALLRSVTPTSHTPALLLQDTFASASGGALPADGYIEGEYAIVKPTPEADGWRDIRVPVNAADTDLSVIARLVSEDPRGQIILARAQNIGTPDYAAYQFVVLPRLRAFGLKLHRGLTDTYLGGMLGISFTNMLPEQPSENGVDLLELKRSGDSVVARINNVVVAPAQDTQLHGPSICRQTATNDGMPRDDATHATVTFALLWRIVEEVKLGSTMPAPSSQTVAQHAYVRVSTVTWVSSPVAAAG